MKEQVLELLMNAKTHVSGEFLSKELGVSRTTVWKYIKKLKEEGYQIDSVSNLGYLIKKESERILQEGLYARLKGFAPYDQVIVLDTIDSTNEEAKRRHLNGSMKEGLVLAREQTLGKGRRGRSWVSGKDQGIYMSLLLKPSLHPTKAPMLTLVAGLAAVKAIEGRTGHRIQIKWPNDLVYEGKKIGGILTEMSAEMDAINYVIIGIGINLSQDMVDPEIKAIAMSLKDILKQDMNPMDLIADFLKEFDLSYRSFLQCQDLAYMIDAYNEVCVTVGNPIRIINGDEISLGYGDHVDKLGQLVITNELGQKETHIAGEVSVRGVYGYI